MGVSRWLRLDIAWDHSEWVIVLEPAAQLAWIKLLCYVKAFGTLGRVKALSDVAAAKTWGVPVGAVRAMVDAGMQDGALALDAKDWIVPNWLQYNPIDTGAAERKRRERSRKTRDDVTASHGVSRVTIVTDREGLSRDSDVDVDVEKQPPAKPDEVSLLWEVYLQELGGKPPNQPTLTPKRRTAIAALHREKLKQADDPPEAFRAILRAVKASGHHMSNRAYQFPESLFGSPEKRDRWWLISQNGNGSGSRHGRLT